MKIQENTAIAVLPNMRIIYDTLCRKKNKGVGKHDIFCHI